MSEECFSSVFMCKTIPFQMSSAHVVSSESSRCAYEVARGKKCCGVSIVFLLRFCGIQKWLLNPSLIPAFEFNLNCGSKQGLKFPFEFREVK